MYTKYVRHSTLGFVLFADNPHVHHVHVGRWLEGTVGGSVTSAGFVAMVSGRPLCYGDSTSLGLMALDGDSEALARQLGMPPARPAAAPAAAT